MKEAASFRKLVELVFTEKFEKAEEMTATDSSIPACSLTDDFSESWQVLLSTKLVIFYPAWEILLFTFCDKMFSSTELYLRGVLFACIYETTYYEYEFDIFLAVCAVLKYFRERILNTTGIDFRDLYTEVAMVTYENITKSYVRERGSFQQLVEYIHGHRYLSLEFKLSTPDAVLDELLENVEVKKELNRRVTCKTECQLEMIEARSVILARKILDRTSFELSITLNNPDLIKGLKGSGSEEKEEKIEEEKYLKADMEFLDSGTTSQVYTISKSDSRNEGTIIHENKEDAKFLDSGATSQVYSKIPRLRIMIEEVFKHYHAQFSGLDISG